MLTSMLVDPMVGLSETGGVLAVTTGVEGSAYRPVGAAMAFLADGSRVGSLSSGCIEEALALEADKTMAAKAFRQVRYGEGSAWIDIKLPCGAGLDVSLWPAAGEDVLTDSSHQYIDRQAYALRLPKAGLESASLEPLAAAGWSSEGFVLPRIPPLRLVVLGTGLETVIFTEIARGAGFDVDVASPDPLVGDALPQAAQLHTGTFPATMAIDNQTAVVLFFHEHDHEASLLPSALQSRAFWVGAQGSPKKCRLRAEELARSGLAPSTIDRLAPRFGLIPSARDPQTLAISVLADVVDAYKAAWFDPYFGQSTAAAR
ncbi:MAG: XdhC family protein [Pseudomonadota bacterium]